MLIDPNQMGKSFTKILAILLLVLLITIFLLIIL